MSRALGQLAGRPRGIRVSGTRARAPAQRPAGLLHGTERVWAGPDGARAIGLELLSRVLLAVVLLRAGSASAI